jgi:hypothetical protein
MGGTIALDVKPEPGSPGSRTAEIAALDENRRLGWELDRGDRKFLRVLLREVGVDA